MIDGMTIADGHAHTYMDSLADKIVSSFTELHRMEPSPSLGKGTVDDLSRKMSDDGVDYTVLANFGPVKAMAKVNGWNLETAKRNRNLIPLVSVHPGMDPVEFLSLIGSGAKGVKMHNSIQEFDPCDPGLDGIYRICSDKGLPVTFHCGEVSRVRLNGYADIGRIEDAVASHEDVTFILTHLAEGDPATVFRLADRYRNIVFDTSIAFSGEHCIHRIHDDFWEDDRNAAEAFRRIGCERVAFGSDYPFGNPVSDVRRILGLDLTRDEKRRILGANTLALYGIK